MLRYRSYSVDFLRKPKVMLEDPEIKSIDDLMDKRATDEERRLTSELYKSAFARVQRGLEDENYFEVICLSQSIMNERLGKILQTFQGIEDKFKLMTGLEETVSNLLSYMDLQNIEIDPELNDLISDISTGQKAIHGWIVEIPHCMNMCLYSATIKISRYKCVMDLIDVQQKWVSNLQSKQSQLSID